MFYVQYNNAPIIANIRHHKYVCTYDYMITVPITRSFALIPAVEQTRVLHSRVISGNSVTVASEDCFDD